MTIDELMRIYSDAARAGSTFPQYETPDHRAGIAAVVRALRDEVDAIWTTEDMGCGTILDVFNQILDSDAGEKATDHAPAVCVWTASSASGLFSARCQPHNSFVQPVDNCHLCGLPIKFTEANT